MKRRNRGCTRMHADKTNGISYPRLSAFICGSFSVFITVHLWLNGFSDDRPQGSPNLAR